MAASVVGAGVRVSGHARRSDGSHEIHSTQGIHMRCMMMSISGLVRGFGQVGEMGSWSMIRETGRERER